MKQYLKFYINNKRYILLYIVSKQINHKKNIKFTYFCMTGKMQLVVHITCVLRNKQTNMTSIGLTPEASC